MPRTMTDSMAAALKANNLRPAIFIEAHFADEVVYIWSGTGSVAWNGQTWLGLGSLLGVSALEDGATVEARGITIRLSGLDPALLAECLGQFQLGLPVLVYLGAWWTDRPSTDPLLIDSPIIVWAGRMDQPYIDVSGETAAITINCENRLLDMNIAVDRRYTLEDAQMDNPGDLGFQFVPGLQEMTLYWGKLPNSTNNI